MSGIVERKVDRRAGSVWQQVDDRIVEESPLEIRLEGTPLAVVMRTPGHEAELILGFALTEGILIGPHELAGIDEIDANRWDLRPVDGVFVDPTRFQRNFYSTSSCGVCGKASIDAIRISSGPLNQDLRVPVDVLAGLPESMRAHQVNFDETGGLHAAAAVTVEGELIALREDVGRHNAVDKLVGALAPDRWRFNDLVLFVSGRMSFEVVQKAAVAGFPVVCGISAASSLAVELGEELGMTVVGFVRGDSCTVYCGRPRIV
ncbi:MAG: formate dehydrogenase accessory sulfurtransferase FdhD [Acidimicrobiia bacterium]|nr:formate dehydrogenase accessory sulfurtransferase FdhD [Acidimicrobiia bacterium]